ncbi:hypothetical protein SERLADRAFT_443685 [Serpula lacrymans var. lacrymans S7.9]|uniref:Uncharacterized protein n=1 Tax=Serpula lacrymans var. lacrymans (strain S7.9) TaxID=578457 RepID=F8PD47_SERL9|nr:uncharacterized protein SERLADRAFT_443685 [Serpula lacrymans var. lacrymans S7.9]EGO19146.1 hypothetical protein SERLADRAFT_443685 [Serpula lacrymans var. lacrymans S7.9]
MSQTTPSQYPNVNFLALISRVLDEANSKEKCELDSPVRIREAKILDSLASIGVWRAQKQVVAAASHFVEDSQHGGKSVVILIAENGPIDKRTVNHIQDVLSRLVTIHTYFREEGLSQDGTLSPIQEYISIVPQSRFETGLLDLELAIIEHSWKKLSSAYLRTVDTPTSSTPLAMYVIPTLRIPSRTSIPIVS